MAERRAFPSNPLRAILAPRNMASAFIGILLPFIILPVILGWFGYSQTRQSLYQSATLGLSEAYHNLSQQVSNWQSEEQQKLAALSSNPTIVQSAKTLESGTPSADSKTRFFQSVQNAAGGSSFSDFFLVNPTDGTIAAATTSEWEGNTLSGDRSIASNWDQPFLVLLINHAIFGPSQITLLAGSRLQAESVQSNLILVGVLPLEEFYSILSAPLENKSLDSILLLFNNEVYVRVDTTQGKISDTQNIPSIRQVPWSAGVFSQYTNVRSTPVVGYTESIPLGNASAIAGQEPATVHILIERNQSSVYSALSYQTIMFAILAVALIAAFLLAMVQSFLYIMRPTRALSSAVDQFAAGHTDVKLPVSGTSELVALSSTLNRLLSSFRDVSQLVGAGGQASTRKLVVSSELVQSLANATTQDDVLRTVVNLIRERMGYDFAAVYTVDEAGQFAVVRAATGAAGERLRTQGNRFPLGSYSIIGSVAQSGRAHVAADVAEDPMYIRNDLLPDTRSEAAFPLRIGKRAVGVLDVHSVSVNGFSPEDLELLQSIADQSSSSLQNVQALETAAVNQEVSQQLIRIGRLVAVATKPDEIYKAVLEGLKGTPYIVTILQSGSDSLRIMGFYNPQNPDVDQPPVAEIRDEPEVLNRLIPSNLPVAIRVESGLVRLPPNFRQYLDALHCRVIGLLPLRQGERMLGAILLSSEDENAITLPNIRPLMPIAESILSALDKLELIQTTQGQLSELATLNRISQSISQATDIQGLYEIIHEQTRNALGDMDIIISLYDSKRDLLTFPYAFVGGESSTLDPTPMGDNLYSLVVRSAQPLMLNENIEERAASLGVRMANPVPKAWLGVPLVTANQVVGVVTLQRSGEAEGLTDEERKAMTGASLSGEFQTARYFTEDNLRLMTTIATQIASTIRTSTLLSESERKAVQLQTAAEIARETIGLLDLDQLLTHSINLIRERFGFYHSSVFLLDDERKFAVLRESTGEAGRQLKSRGHKLGVGSQSIVGWVTQNARPRVADDVTADPMHHPNPLLPATRAELGIPLRIGETVIGALDVQSTSPYAFAPDDITILQVISDQIAIAVENARLFSTTRDYLARHRSLYQVTTAAASSTTLDNALFSAAQGLRVTMNGARVAVYLFSPDKDYLVVRAHSGFQSRDIDTMQMPIGQGVQGWVIANKQPSLVSSTAADTRYFMIDPDIQSELCVPLIHRDELLGVLDMQSPQIAAFSEDDVQLLGTVASSLAAIMSSTVLFEQVTQERERLRHLYEEAIGMAGPPAGDMDTLLRSSLERVRSVSGADCVSIAFPSGQDEVKIEMCTCEPHYKHLTGLVAHYGQDVIGEALSTNQSVRYTPASTGTLSRSLAQAGIRTALALPLQWAGRTIGGLLLSRMSSERPFATEESQLANLLALQVAATIESARLFDQTRHQAEREHLLFEITSRIRRSVDMQGILSTTASELSKALGARRASIKIGLPESPKSEGGDGDETPNE